MEPNQPILIKPDNPASNATNSSEAPPVQPALEIPVPQPDTPINTENIYNAPEAAIFSDIQNPVLSQSTFPNTPIPTQPSEYIPGSSKSLQTTVLLSFFGFLGLDRFYLRKFITGGLKLLTLGGLGIWLLYDEILLLIGNTKDSLGNPLTTNNRKKVVIIGLVLFIIQWALIGVSTPKDISLVRNIGIFQSSKVKMNNYLSANPLSIIGNTIPLDISSLTTDGEQGIKASFSSDCTQLSTDNQTVAMLPKMPDATANNDLKTFINGINGIVRICKAGIPNTSLEINSYNAFITQINTSSANLNKRLDLVIGVSSSTTTI
jgi:hypothetical protein